MLHSQPWQPKPISPTMKSGACKSLVLMFVQTNLTSWDSMVHYSRCTQQNHQSLTYKKYPEGYIPGVDQGSVMVLGSLEDRKEKATRPDILTLFTK